MLFDRIKLNNVRSEIMEGINIGLDEYMDVVNQIEGIDKKVNTEKRKITENEAEKELRLLVQLLEFKNSRITIKKAEKENIRDNKIRKFSPYSNFYFATTKTNKYECAIVDDLPSMFIVQSIDGLRNLESGSFIGKTYKHSLSICLDKKWYVDRMHDLSNVLHEK